MYNRVNVDLDILDIGWLIFNDHDPHKIISIKIRL